MLRVANPRNSSDSRRFPRPVGGCLNKNPVTVKEVEGGMVGKLRNNEGTLESSNLSASTILGGLWIGGVDIIIMMVAGAVEDGLEVGRKGHWEKGKKEKSEGKNERGESLIKRVNTQGEP